MEVSSYAQRREAETSLRRHRDDTSISQTEGLREARSRPPVIPYGFERFPLLPRNGRVVCTTPKALSGRTSCVDIRPALMHQDECGVVECYPLNRWVGLVDPLRISQSTCKLLLLLLNSFPLHHSFLSMTVQELQNPSRNNPSFSSSISNPEVMDDATGW